ncbi:uncharacterized protein LY89DRAFT_80055 [Mollisia scopiformis]|uniref:Uncharacterized protein n=1 Tax=Mollisia scopiformis TaxID=149040 RepID=A0A194X835_MOLSC|nr:uncharacterized protein LY89DRAFT_80055 [Mollisia scopiformis]KUJ16328.1 hypothetical protein LY89DRAFT_80055 [Mollisia scopiformis]
MEIRDNVRKCCWSKSASTNQETKPRIRYRESSPFTDHPTGLGCAPCRCQFFHEDRQNQQISGSSMFPHTCPIVSVSPCSLVVSALLPPRLACRLSFLLYCIYQFEFLDARRAVSRIVCTGTGHFMVGRDNLTLPREIERGLQIGECGTPPAHPIPLHLHLLHARSEESPSTCTGEDAYDVFVREECARCRVRASKVTTTPSRVTSPLLFSSPVFSQVRKYDHEFPFPSATRSSPRLTLSRLLDYDRLPYYRDAPMVAPKPLYS